VTRKQERGIWLSAVFSYAKMIALNEPALNNSNFPMKKEAVGAAKCRP
jgi:hypothetical protein